MGAAVAVEFDVGHRHRSLLVFCVMTKYMYLSHIKYESNYLFCDFLDLTISAVTVVIYSHMDLTIRLESFLT